MDPNSARQVLRIFPDAPLTVELVERAYSGEAWARHPSRYQDASERLEAERWAQTLAVAREVLVHEARAVTVRAAKRRLPVAAIVGIVAGSAAVVALITFGVFAMTTFATQTATAAGDAIEAIASEAASPAEEELPDLEAYDSAETGFTFSAALEIYYDGRLSVDCAAEYEQGCWQMALFPDESCETMHVELAYSNSPTSPDPAHTQTIVMRGVLAASETDVVFGHDGFDYGWINDVTCSDSAALDSVS